MVVGTFKLCIPSILGNKKGHIMLYLVAEPYLGGGGKCTLLHGEANWLVDLGSGKFIMLNIFALLVVISNVRASCWTATLTSLTTSA